MAAPDKDSYSDMNEYYDALGEYYTGNTVMPLGADDVSLAPCRARC